VWVSFGNGRAALRRVLAAQFTPKAFGAGRGPTKIGGLVLSVLRDFGKIIACASAVYFKAGGSGVQVAGF
jgi:hypothetical protein